MEGSCSTGQSPQRAVVPMEEEVQNKASFSLSKPRILKWPPPFFLKICALLSYTQLDYGFGVKGLALKVV
jgi:hypothetical protein